MAQLFAAFGLDWRLLVINLINFVALLAVLYYFLYGPITKMLATRREKMAEGVRNADAAKERLSEIEASRAELLAQAGRDADDVMVSARAAARERGEEIVSASQASAENIRRTAEAEATELKAQALRESKQEVAKLIVLGMEHTMLDKFEKPQKA